MKSAPMIEPEIVATPPIRTIAMNCTDRSRLNEPGSKKSGDRVEQRTGAARVERRERERQHLVPGEADADDPGRDVTVADRRERPPDRDRARFRASSAKITSRTNISRYRFCSRVRRAVLVEPVRRTSPVIAASRPTPGRRSAVHSLKMCSPRKTSPSVTIARYRPRRRVASGATIARRGPRRARRRAATRAGSDPVADDPPVRVAGYRRRRVRADPEEERVAERHLAGVPGDEVEPDGPDRGDEADGQQLEQVVLEEERSGQRQHHERRRRTPAWPGC